MKIAGSVTRSWTHDSYFSLCTPIHRGEECPGRNVQGGCPDTDCVWEKLAKDFPLRLCGSMNSDVKFPPFKQC